MSYCKGRVLFGILRVVFNIHRYFHGETTESKAGPLTYDSQSTIIPFPFNNYSFMLNRVYPRVHEVRVIVFI